MDVDEAENGAAIGSRRRTVRPAIALRIAEVGAHLAWQVFGDWIGAARSSRRHFQRLRPVPAPVGAAQNLHPMNAHVVILAACIVATESTTTTARHLITNKASFLGCVPLDGIGIDFDPPVVEEAGEASRSRFDHLMTVEGARSNLPAMERLLSPAN
jgi:hypothetical protein